MKRVRQRVGENGEEHPRFGMGAGQMHGAVQRHNGLARAGGAGDAGWPGVVALHPLALFGMQEDRPFLPREIEGALEFLDVRHHTEAALGVGMIKRIRDRRGRLSYPRLATRGLQNTRFATRSEFQEGFGRFSGQAVRQQQEVVFGGLAHVVEPLSRHAVAQ